MSRSGGGRDGGSINSVFYADTYHPIQAGSIDGTDILPHDNGVYRAVLCSKAALYDPFGDPKVNGDPYCTLFVGRLSHLTTEESLRKAMNEYGRVKNLRLVRHIVTGASRGYAFVEFETEKEMRRAYKDAHHTYIDDSEIIVDYNRQQLMPGWIPRRLGGGLGGKKESGQLRFGGRERPFRAPLRQIPFDDLTRLGIPAPPQGRYMKRSQIPSPPRRRRSRVETEELDEKERRRNRSSTRGRERSSSPDGGGKYNSVKEMECFRTRLSLLLLLHAFLLLFSLQVRSDEEDDLLQGINSFRQTASAPPLVKHGKADCVADEIADKIEDKSCASNTMQSQLMSDYPSVMKKCKVDINTTTDGMILPVCVPHRVATLVLTNYTQSQNSKYLNSSKFTGAGIGSEDDWTILVLTTNTPGGSFASGARRCLTMATAYYAPSIILFVFSLVFLY